MKKLQSEREFYKSLGKHIRHMRKKSGLSPYYAGRMIGIHGMLFAEMECGRIPPTPYQVYRIIHMWHPELLKDWK